MSLVARVRSRTLSVRWPAALVGLIAAAPTAVAAPQTWGELVSSGAGDSVTGVCPGFPGLIFGGSYESGRTNGDLGGPQLGGGDAFVTRRDGGGNVLWSRKVATPNVDEGRGVAPDGNQGVFFAGNRNGVANAQTVVDFDAFVAHYDSLGNLLWQRAVGAAQWEELTSCAPDGAGGVFVAGHSYPDEAAANFGQSDIWVARYDANGSQLWLERFGSNVKDVCTRVESDGAGGALLCGWTFGSLGGAVQGSPDAWYARFDGSGAQQWLRQLGSTQSVHPNAPFLPGTFANGLVADGAGGSFLVGGTSAMLEPGATTREKALVLRLDAQGDTLWLEQFGATGTESVRDVELDAQGVLHLAGSTSSDYVVSGAGSTDVWIQRADTSGNLLEALQFGSKNQETVSQIALVGAGVVVAGDVSGFDDLFGVPTNYENGFVARFTDCEFGAETNYCSSKANSTGWASKLGSSGSAKVSNNDFGLFATFVPDQQPGVFLMGTATNQTPFGNGTLCVGGTVLRLPVDEVQFSVVETHLDMTDASSPAALITAGSTWHFQLWFRDTAGGGAGFDLSNGLSVTFCP